MTTNETNSTANEKIDIDAICTKCAKIVKAKFYCNRCLEYNELYNIGFLYLSSNPLISEAKAYSDAYLHMLHFAHHFTKPAKQANDRQMYLVQISSYNNTDALLDIIEAMKTLNSDDIELIKDYVIEGMTYREMCEKYKKRNQASVKYLLDKALNSLRWLLRSWR